MAFAARLRDSVANAAASRALWKKCSWPQPLVRARNCSVRRSAKRLRQEHKQLFASVLVEIVTEEATEQWNVTKKRHPCDELRYRWL